MLFLVVSILIIVVNAKIWITLRKMPKINEINRANMMRIFKVHKELDLFFNLIQTKKKILKMLIGDWLSYPLLMIFLKINGEKVKYKDLVFLAEVDYLFS